MYIIRLSLIFSLAGMSSCVSVPKETVELSSTIVADLAEIESSHTALVNKYYQLIKADINRLVDELYVPYMIELTIDRFSLIDRIENSSGQDQLDIMTIFVEEMNSEIQSFRESLFDPVDENHQAVLAAVQAGYSNIRYANAALTTYLDSAYAVAEERQTIFKELGLSGLPDSLIEKSAEISSFLEDNLRELSKVDAGMDKVSEISSGIKKILDSKN